MLDILGVLVLSGLPVILRTRTDLWSNLGLARTGGGTGTPGSLRGGGVGRAPVFLHLAGVPSKCPCSGLKPLGLRLGRGVIHLQGLENKEKDSIVHLPSKHFLNPARCGASQKVGVLDHLEPSLL